MDRVRFASLRDWRASLVAVPPLKHIGGLVGDMLEDFDMYMDYIEKNPDTETMHDDLCRCERIRRDIRKLPGYALHLPDTRTALWREKKKAKKAALQTMLKKPGRRTGVVRVRRQKKNAKKSQPHHIFFDD